MALKGTSGEFAFSTQIGSGTFSTKFELAAEKAAECLANSLYATYYGINYSLFKRSASSSAQRFQKSSQQGDNFAKLIAARAGVSSGTSVATKGMIIEQQQIVTTHNLATLTIALNLHGVLSGQATTLARNCFVWVCRRLCAPAPTHHDRLIAIKNSAYAWRQMVFYLSLLDTESQQRFIARMQTELTNYPAISRGLFAPAVLGLRAASTGITPSRLPGKDGVQFLGWTNKQHWLACR